MLVRHQLLAGPLRFTPRGSFYEFEGQVSFARMCTSIDFPISMASHRVCASVRCAASSTEPRRDGPVTAEAALVDYSSAGNTATLHTWSHAFAWILALCRNGSPSIVREGLR
jgi:hypothetical protein